MSNSHVPPEASNQGSRNRRRRKESPPPPLEVIEQKIRPPAKESVSPVAAPARIRVRHAFVFVSFFLMVVIPSAIGFLYLYSYAADQFSSEMGFSVQKEEADSAIDIIGGLTAISNQSSSDTDILYEFIQSQKMALNINEKLNLRRLYSKPNGDPIFALVSDASNEDLVKYWRRMVKVFYNGSNGLIQVRVHAFEPEDAHAIANEILIESTKLVNQLSAIAQQDVTEYATDELERASNRLKEARLALLEFRSENQIFDPNADLQLQMGLLSTLHAQLADAMVEADLLTLKNISEQDPRVENARHKVNVIRARIDEERLNFSEKGFNGPAAFSFLINSYERLVVEKEFSEGFYLSALAAYNGARAEGFRKSRYLAAYMEPTLAETAQYPKKLIIGSLIVFFSFLIWSILTLAVYAVRDRR